MQFRAILIDPPVPFRVWGAATGMGRSAESHYSTMTWADLNALGPYIRSVCDPRGTAVFLWLCQPLLIETLDMARHGWGLEYKTKAFAWVKTYTTMTRLFKGMGYWTRANTEDVLLFTLGQPRRKAKNVPQAIHRIMNLLGLLDGRPRMRRQVPTLIAPVSKHSQKPTQIHRAITDLVDGPYLELFARRPIAGWTCLGNEIDGQDIRQSLLRLAQQPDPADTPDTQHTVPLHTQPAGPR